MVNLQSRGKLSGNLEKLLVDVDYDYTDAEIVVEGIPVGVHRCILAAMSEFFHQLFKSGSKVSIEEGKPRYLMSDLVPHGRVGYESFKVVLTYLYTGNINPSPLEVATCVEDGCAHDACGPAISYAVELMYASSIFQIEELVLIVQRHLQDFMEKALVEDIIPVTVAAFNCKLNPLLLQCIEEVARSDLDNVFLDKELPYEILSKIQALRLKSEKNPCIIEDVNPTREKAIKNIHKALDADDDELVKLLLSESTITLDDAFALHYAAAYCDPKVIKKILSLHSVNLNLRNNRGYTVLHVAARRKDLKVILALLDNKASALEPTRDGQTAASICRRLTRPKDYYQMGDESNKDRLCVEVLERETMRNSILQDQSMASQEISGDTNMMLGYLEDRVRLALSLFPAEAKMAMSNADADADLSTVHNRRFVQNKVDPIENPSVMMRILEGKVQRLLKTVETGRRYFPHCSNVLDDLLHDRPNDLYLEEGTPEERERKKLRLMEIKEEYNKAFDEDVFDQSASAPSSTSPKNKIQNKVRKR